MKFIDLFAGLGGFHIALNKLGHDCVFSSEKKEQLANLYEDNYKIKVNRDITKIDIAEIPSHDILCAGFPCQPFSKAGFQEGLNDKSNGSLFDKISDILKFHKPKYFILENVRNLENHNEGKTWKYIYQKLNNDLGYSVSSKILSPHKYGIPQHRERFFIIGSLVEDITNFSWPKIINSKKTLRDFLIDPPNGKFNLELNKQGVLEIWQEFLNIFPREDKLPSWPIWSMEFGATYPFEDKTPFASSSIALGKTKGNFGISLKGMNRVEKFKNLPSYAKEKRQEFPKWKKHFIRSNREFYLKYYKIIDPVVDKIKKLKIPSHQKFEWNIQGGERNIYKHLIQFRGSGVRVKKANYFPSLVTVKTQTPIIGWKLRYITPQEGAKIQSLNMIKLPKNDSAAYGALGNAVNAKLVYIIMKNLVGKTNP